MWAGTRIRFRTRRQLCTFYEGRLSAFHQFFLASAEFFWGQLRNQYVFFRIRHYKAICETAGGVQTLIAAPEYRVSVQLRHVEFRVFGCLEFGNLHVRFSDFDQICRPRPTQALGTQSTSW